MSHSTPIGPHPKPGALLDAFLASQTDVHVGYTAAAYGDYDYASALFDCAAIDAEHLVKELTRVGEDELANRWRRIGRSWQSWAVECRQVRDRGRQMVLA